MIETNVLISTVEWAVEKIVEYFWPWTVVKCYEGGVLLRFGEYKRNLHVGINWKWPFFIDEALTATVTIDTFHVTPVDITTTDNLQVSVEPIVKFEITDVKKYLLETNEALGNLHDISRGVIADYLADCSWPVINKRTTLTEIKNALKKECEDMGVKVHKVYFGRIVTTKIYTVYKE